MHCGASRLTQALAGMGNSESALGQILRVGRESSIRGAGISIQAALTNARYKELRTTFSPSDLIPMIHADPTLVRDWLLYSQDKRTSGGWYLLESGEVAQVNSQGRLQFPSIQVAVAEYVVRELDFWAGVAG
jgi:hypothetical protein